MRSILSPETTTTVSRSVPPLPSSRVATLRAIGRLGCGSSHVSGGLFATPSSAAGGWDCTGFIGDGLHSQLSPRAQRGAFEAAGKVPRYARDDSGPVSDICDSRY